MKDEKARSESGDTETAREALAETETTLEPESRPLPRFPGFTVLEKVGSGGFGAVFRARDERLQREVALKVQLPPARMRDDAKRRFLREAQALARIRHPNVLTIHSVIEEDGAIGLVTEFIDGQPLSEIVEELGPLGASEAARVGIELCRALAAVHGAGLIHRDVKSPNVLRERGGRIVLTDFGLGVLLAEGEALKAYDLFAGSPLFMAPEQIRGDRLDARTDLYAAGVLLYHVSTGKFPVSSFAIGDLLPRIERGELTPLCDARPDLPESFTRVVTKAMSRAPEARYGSAGELEAALAACAGGMEPIGAAGATGSRRWWAGTVVAGLVAVLLLAFLPLFLRAGPVEVERSELYLEADGGDRLLEDGAPVEKGDALFLRYRAPEDLHVYVINEDESGVRVALFPHRLGRLQNPLPGGVLHRLPGVIAGEDVNWVVSSSGGRESIIIVASRNRIDGLEDAARSTVPGGEGYPAVGDDEIAGLRRGIEGLAKRSTRQGERLRELIGGFVEARNGRGGLWVRKITLENR